MVVIGIKDGVVVVCVSVDEIGDVKDYYPDHLLLEQTGEENIGWNYDGVKFTPPAGG